MAKLFLFISILAACSVQAKAEDVFPDGKPVPAWFRNTEKTDPAKLGKTYRVTDFGVSTDSTLLQTEQLQHVIDLAASQGGGVVLIPRGTFLSGSLFFRQGTHLCLDEGAVLKGSDDISHFPIVKTRMEGQTLQYFAALVNANSLDGFRIFGRGTLNGNGLRYWKSFWLRRKVNPRCTNIEELRPRVLYVSHCNDVQVEGIRVANSPFWSTHFYRCTRVKMLNVRVTSPSAPVKAPSTDAMDIDACSQVLVKGCYLSVNDDAIALKGGKGPWADQDPDNGANEDIIIEDCHFGFCHGVVTCGSESIHTRNLILRRCLVEGVQRLLWLKMRPDTPQVYEHILVEDIKGSAQNLLFVAPWTQFYDLKGRKDTPMSYSRQVTLRRITMECNNFFAVKASPEQYELSDFRFEDLDVRADHIAVDRSIIRNFVTERVNLSAK